MMSTPQQVKEMVAVLDDEALTEAFARPDAFVRPETKEILDAALYTWLFSHTRVELTAAAQAGGWPFAHVNSPADVLEADHFHQRGFWAEVPHGDGRLLLAGPPYRHAEGGWQLHRTSPAVGQHDNEIDAESMPDRRGRHDHRHDRDHGEPTGRGRGARTRARRRRRSRGSASSTSPPCGRARTSRSSSPTSARR